MYDQARPGYPCLVTHSSEVQRSIEVLNTTDSTLHVEVYPAAATITHGSFVGAASRKRNDGHRHLAGLASRLGRPSVRRRNPPLVSPALFDDSAD